MVPPANLLLGLSHPGNVLNYLKSKAIIWTQVGAVAKNVLVAPVTLVGVKQLFNMA